MEDQELIIEGFRASWALFDREHRTVIRGKAHRDPID